MIWILAAMAQDVTVTGPRYRQLVTAERQLTACVESHTQGVAALTDCRARVLRARELALGEVRASTEALERQSAQITALATERDTLDRKLARVRDQRNTVIAAGLVAVVALGVAAAL